MWSVARRPRWILALVLALGIAAGFAALGQWQIGRAVQTATVVIVPDETVTPLARVARSAARTITAPNGKTGLALAAAIASRIAC